MHPHQTQQPSPNQDPTPCQKDSQTGKKAFGSTESQTGFEPCRQEKIQGHDLLQ